MVHEVRSGGSSLPTTAFGVLWQLPLTVGPLLFGKAIDDGVVPALARRHALLGRRCCSLVTLIGAVFGIPLHTLVVRSWLIGLYGTMKMVTRKVAQMGHVLPRRTPTGEVLSVAVERLRRVRRPDRDHLPRRRRSWWPTSWSRSSC